MKNEDKNNCIDSIARMLDRTAAWRRSLSARFPEDSRNTRAANTLDKLSEDVANISDDQLLELEPYYSAWDSEKWRSGLSQTARSVGFHTRTREISFFVKVLVKNLSGVAA